MLLNCKITNLIKDNIVDVVSIGCGRNFKNIAVFSASCVNSSISLNDNIFLVNDQIGLLLNPAKFENLKNCLIADNAVIGKIDFIEDHKETSNKINLINTELEKIKLFLRGWGFIG